MLALRYIALYRTRLLCGVVEVEGALCLDVVVSPVAERVVGADQNLGAAARELCGDELLFVVLLVCGCKLSLYVFVLNDRLDCLGNIRKLWCGLALPCEGGARRTSCLARRRRLHKRAEG